ncbi:MAG: UDP-4-amino-4,6-dideoxy-N-acetyl-beta-L-altrosamine transaminase [Magnetovibrio sp.]|nr:UDP-4-amino-4,6-dideoxy-N-acetyl-beta-L-altrosamine transaminase [Magnetovibrio sp.]
MSDKSQFLSYGRHFVDADDRKAVDTVLRGDWLTQGDTIARFEATLAEAVGAKYAVAVSNGTAGLHLACLAAGLDKNDRSLTSALTFVASANAGLYCAAQSDVGDIDPQTLCLSADAVKSAVAKHANTKVIIPVHFAGLSADVKAIRAAAPDALIVEDACHALGGQDADGNNVGSCAYSDMVVFSFHPVKPITTAEGGAITTNDKGLYQKLMKLRSHGIERDVPQLMEPDQGMDGGECAPWYYEQQMLGFNYRLTDIQAALGLSQLSKLDRFTQRRREIVKRYDQAFADVNYIKTAQNLPHQRSSSAHHLYLGLFDYMALGLTRTQVMQRLRKRNIGTQVHYIPVYRQPYHKQRLGDVADQFPNTEEYYAQALSLPIFPNMSDDDVERVITAVKELVRQA